MTRRERGIVWGALIVGLLVGVGGGLVYAWVVNPVRYEDITPRELRAEAQREYILLVGHAYLGDFDLERAQRRLASLGRGDLAAEISQQADEAYLRGGNPGDARALTVLAEALGAHPQAAEVFSGTLPPISPVGATITPTVENGISSTPTEIMQTDTPTVEPTLTPTQVQIPENTTMKLTVLKPLCLDGGLAGQIQVYVIDAAGGGIPAVKIQVTWNGNADAFFTGAKPEISPGFADFQMEKDKTYTVTLPGLSEPVVGISSADCLTESGQVSTPTYQLVFVPAGPF